MGGKHKRKTQVNAVTRDVESVRIAALVSQSATPIPVGAYPLSVVEAAGIAAVRRCVTLIANAIAGQPWTEWSGRDQIEPVSRIVKRPAALMSRREWAWRVIAGMALDDLCYLRMIGGVDDEGVPGSLVPLPREAIAPAGYADPWGIFPPTQYNISGVAGTVSAEEVIVMRSAFWPGVPPHLVGVLRMARNSLMQAWAADTYATKYWQSGGSPLTTLTTEQELTNPQAEVLAQRWLDRRMMGPTYPAVLGKGAHAEPYGADIAGGQAMRDAVQNITLEICNLFGVPGRYANVTPEGGSMTYANINDEALSLERFTLSGFIEPIEDVITDLLPEERNMQIDMTKLTRAGQESRFRAWQAALNQKPFMLAEEVRAYEGLPPSPELEQEAQAKVEAAAAAAASFNGVKPAAPEEVPQEEQANA
jgi:HK97 family phage portal protein